MQAFMFVSYFSLEQIGTKNDNFRLFYGFVVQVILKKAS